MNRYQIEVKRERNRLFRNTHPDYQQQWRKDHPEKVKEYLEKEYSTECRRTYMRLYMKEYRESQKECAL